MQSNEQIVVLTQACDLAHQKASRVQVAPVHLAAKLVEHGLLKASVIRDHVRRHRVYGWYFLPAAEGFPESLVDLRQLHTVLRSQLDELIAAGERACSLGTPYREHLAQQFALTYARIALPHEYQTDPS